MEDIHIKEESEKHYVMVLPEASVNPPWLTKFLQKYSKNTESTAGGFPYCNVEVTATEFDEPAPVTTNFKISTMKSLFIGDLEVQAISIERNNESK